MDVNKISIEKKCQTVNEILNHTLLVVECARILGEKLVEEDEENFYFHKQLLQRCLKHDNTKFNHYEFFYIHFGGENEKKEGLKIHRQTNKHHGLYWPTHNHMDKISIGEMVCDWKARSVQFGNDLNKFFVGYKRNHNIKDSGLFSQTASKYVDILQNIKIKNNYV